MKKGFAVKGVIALMVFFAGCVPETLYMTTPEDTNTIWYSGREFQTKTVDSITVSVAYESEIGGNWTFYMVVGNSGDKPVLIAPEQFYCNGVKILQLGGWSAAEGRYVSYTRRDTAKIFAYDPESVLRGINGQVEQATATYATSAGINAATALLQLIGGVATIGQNKTPEQRKAEAQQNRQLQSSEAQNQTDYDSQIQNLSNQKDYWENATLRKTTLFPNNAIAGKVIFPLDTSMTTFTLVFPVDTTSIEFGFKQSPVGK